MSGITFMPSRDRKLLLKFYKKVLKEIAKRYKTRCAFMTKGKLWFVHYPHWWSIGDLVVVSMPDFEKPEIFVHNIEFADLAKEIKRECEAYLKNLGEIKDEPLENVEKRIEERRKR